MIITLTGSVTHKADNYAVIEVGGVGYQVFMTGAALFALVSGSEARVWTHDYPREDARELYGFLTQAEHRLFVRLIAISGIGPRAALAILGLGGARRVEEAIEQGDVAFLSSASGIGKKTAQKIVLELQGKLVTAAAVGGNEEVLVALVSLGYDRAAAAAALAKLGSEGLVEERLRAALRELGR
jgi:Holliday junction DNA helicase RuvA